MQNILAVQAVWGIHMDALTDKEIQKASNAIDKALQTITKTNRGEVALRIVTVVRNLNDHIAYKVWQELRPNQEMGLQKVASKFDTLRPYQFIARFDRFLRASVSHFTPTEEGAERLLLKYYRFILLLKQLMLERYHTVIIENADRFLEDLDEQTRDYYKKVAERIEQNLVPQQSKSLDNYYIDKIKPFFVNNHIYYEVTLEPAAEKPNKFNRITAFTNHSITTNYCVALAFLDTVIDVFHVHFPIKLITEWHISIRPCEINNFARILNIPSSVKRGAGEYKALMEYLEYNQLSLVDILDFDDTLYGSVKQYILSRCKGTHCVIVEILDRCRTISIENDSGKNILRYLLQRMNNRIIKDQWPYRNGNTYGDLYLSSKCIPFDRHPYSFNPKGHISNLYDLFECIDPTGHESELLARFIEKNTNPNGVLFTPIDDLKMFGSAEKIEMLITRYNASLSDRFRPDSELGIYKNCVFKKEHESKTVQIISSLGQLSKCNCALSSCFSAERVEQLKTLSDKFRLDDPAKAKILADMFQNSRVHFIYGAAGTGKTTLVNHITSLTASQQKIYLAQTNPAVENLRRKVVSSGNQDEFMTIDRFIGRSRYNTISCDLIVIDECSTVKNDDILTILSLLGEAALVLIGDTHQIEAIGFGNWFNICRKAMPSYCCHELTTPHRSTDKNLKKLWDEVRNMGDSNVVLEQTVRNDYSHPIDEDIFTPRAEDEIILCLNYSGLYGLNNINRLLQLSNPMPPVDIGILRFKVNDPVLFNDSRRFPLLYNNLKGKIVALQDYQNLVYFVLDVELELSEDDVAMCEGLDFIEQRGPLTRVGFIVNRMPPYSSDEESTSNEHILPMQVAYAVSIHKSQGLEYDSVKIVIADETEERITHNIFYTAVTRARSELTIYWSPEVCNHILNRIRPTNSDKDYHLLKAKNSLGS